MNAVSRRTMLAGTGVMATALFAGRGAPACAADPTAKPIARAAATPEAALALLEAGNAAFLRGASTDSDIGPKRRLELAAGQAPFCAYVSCSDSRVPPALLFDFFDRA